MLTMERGAASLRIVLNEGTVTVFHGTDGNVLLQFPVYEGAWEAMFDAMVATLQTNEIPQEALAKLRQMGGE